MAVELGGISLEHLTQVRVSEGARIVHHPVPGMSGDLAQTLGRPSVRVALAGIFYGPDAADELKQLRDAFLARQPLDFYAEAVGEGYFAQVLVAGIEVTQRAGYLDQFDFACQVIEYVEPPEPAAADPFAGLNTDLVQEAAGFMDDVQGALEQVSQLTGLLNLPSFADPTSRLPEMLTTYTQAAGAGTSVLQTIRELF